jgi:hypothetical protein
MFEKKTFSTLSEQQFYFRAAKISTEGSRSVRRVVFSWKLFPKLAQFFWPLWTSPSLAPNKVLLKALPGDTLGVQFQ